MKSRSFNKELINDYKDGKSYKYLLNFIVENQYSKEEARLMIIYLNSLYSNERELIAKRDFKFGATVLIIYILFTTFLFIRSHHWIVFFGRHLLLLLASIFFLKSWYFVYPNRQKFVY